MTLATTRRGPSQLPAWYQKSSYQMMGFLTTKIAEPEATWLKWNEKVLGVVLPLHSPSNLFDPTLPQTALDFCRTCVLL